MSTRPWPTTWLIDGNEISRYLLDLNHPEGKHKAKIFLAFGFTLSDPEEFAHALATHPWINPQERLKMVPMGLPRLTFEGPLATPDGRSPRVRTVWELMSDDTARFLTAYPGR